MDVPALSRLRLSSSCADLHSRISNDESYDLAALAQRVAGRFISMRDDRSPESFAAVLRTGQALDVSARVLTWAMAVQGLRARWWGYAEIMDGVEGWPRIRQSTRSSRRRRGRSR